jgi:hypothetical protein
MHTEEQLRAAARNAGVRVLGIRNVHSPVGPVVVGRFEATDNEQAFRLLQEFAEDDVGDAIARTVGLDVRHRFGPDQVRMAKAIQQWVKTHVDYLPEPTETFQAPWYTVATAIGDCDDHANLVHAIARNAGLKARLAPVRNKEQQIRHACAQIYVDGVWSWAETTLDADFDEAPRAAASRLKSNREDISGAEGEAMTVVLTGANLPMRQGVRYRARARVDTPKALTPITTIQAFFEDSGFANVSIYAEPGALPADWPADQRQAIAGGALGGWTAFVEGTWAQADQGIPRPEPLLAVWQADQITPTSSGPGVVTLPEVLIVGDVPGPINWKVGAFLFGTAAAVIWVAMQFGRPE